MYNLLLSLAGGGLVAGAVYYAGYGVAATAIPGVLIAIGLYVLLARRTIGKLQQVATLVQAELTSMTANRREQQTKVERAVKLLENTLPLGRWQFLVTSEIHGQIGMLKYLFKDIPGAMASFKLTGNRNSLARTMQGAIHYQRKEYPEMERAFESAVKYGRKEGLYWATYAWCLIQSKQSAKAVPVLTRAVAANPSDENLKKALAAVQNDKRLKMNAWEPQWWQLGLEAPPAQQPQHLPGSRRRMLRGR